MKRGQAQAQFEMENSASHDNGATPRALRIGSLRYCLVQSVDNASTPFFQISTVIQIPLRMKGEKLSKRRLRHGDGRGGGKGEGGEEAAGLEVKRSGQW